MERVWLKARLQYCLPADICLKGAPERHNIVSKWPLSTLACIYLLFLRFMLSPSRQNLTLTCKS